MSPLRPLKLAAAAAAIAATAAAAAPAPAAGADTNDAAYIGALIIGAVPVTSTNYAIALGHAVCIDLDNGFTYADEYAAIVVNNLSFTLPDAAYLVGAAIAAYCPRHNLGAGPTERA